MSVVACDFPAQSAVDRRWVAAATFRDSYRAPLQHPGAGIVDVFFAMFAHHPLWVKVLLIVRNWVASMCGLSVPRASEILHLEIKDRYCVGDKIGVWPIYSLSDDEVVAGRDNKHLDFRLSVLRVAEGPSASVIVSTVCSAHNTFGKVYLFFIVPFHKWGVQRMIANAVRAGRL